jgi:hypothetical protein
MNALRKITLVSSPFHVIYKVVFVFDTSTRHVVPPCAHFMHFMHKVFQVNSCKRIRVRPHFITGKLLTLGGEVVPVL